MMNNTEEKTEYYYKVKDFQTRQEIRSFWKKLIADKSYKAKLKHCNKIDEIKGCMGLNAFKEILPRWTSYEATALIMGLLAYVKEDSKEPLGKKLAEKKGDRPLLSEEKLHILLSCRTLDDLYKNLRRFITFIKGDVDPLSIIDFVLQWEDENRNIKRPNFGKNLKFKYYKYYYTQK